MLATYLIRHKAKTTDLRSPLWVTTWLLARTPAEVPAATGGVLLRAWLTKQN